MSDAPEKISRAEKRRRNALAFHEQQAEAEASCVPCKLCGGKAVIKDAGPGWGYYIECENAYDKSWRGRATCLQSGARLSGWAYNVSDLWNSLNATPAALAACPEVQALIRDGWRNDPENSEAWCAGNDYALTRLCKVLGVDPDKVDWDGSDGSRDEEADALIWRILHANDDDDGRSPAIREAEARGMERIRLAFERVDQMVKDAGEFTESAWADLSNAILEAQ